MIKKAERTTKDAGIWHSKSTFHSQSRISVHIPNVNVQKRTDMQRVRSIFQFYSKITSHKRSLSHTYQCKRGKRSPGTLFHSIRCVSMVSTAGLFIDSFSCLFVNISSVRWRHKFNIATSNLNTLIQLYNNIELLNASKLQYRNSYFYIYLLILYCYIIILYNTK